MKETQFFYKYPRADVWRCALSTCSSFGFLVVLLLALGYIIFTYSQVASLCNPFDIVCWRHFLFCSYTAVEPPDPSMTPDTTPNPSTVPPILTTRPPITTRNPPTAPPIKTTSPKKPEPPTTIKTTVPPILTTRPPITTRNPPTAPPIKTTTSQKTLPPTTTLKTSPPQLQPHVKDKMKVIDEQPLICVFGIHKQNYEAINVENICDYAFIPFYAQTAGDTFKDDTNKIVAALLNKAATSKRTQYGIHIKFT
ncbi:hypothetical protein HPB48_023007 [Haemaphysalis longicornis]|uniref:Uncharacterized protein n=1 Tax=Haemaphysalis longicornis TaxID=44386 RepID=A0A9J6GFV7_HAELO|nr:hypothetical protein HPB48_023007 [Haemaphysalis longicornis]